jgi:hypothetical protein
MQLKATGTINLPNAAGSLFDHGAFEPRSRRVFVAHTVRDRVEVIDYDAKTKRGAARLAWVDAYSLEKRAEFETGLRPDGVRFCFPAEACSCGLYR